MIARRQKELPSSQEKEENAYQLAMKRAGKLISLTRLNLKVGKMDIPRFHLAFPIVDIEATRAFYHGLLGCEVGRESDHWIDFNFFGHQITGHTVAAGQDQVPVSEVDGKGVPIPHFGAILDWDAWHQLADHLRANDIPFLIEPHIRFPGEIAEQATMFIKDPSGNGVEFKAFQDLRCAWAHNPEELQSPT